MSPKEPIIPARLMSRVGLADGLAVLTVLLERDFLFRPGQHATLWLTHHGITIPRPYSIASSPNHPRQLEFYLNLVAEGQMTPSLWDPEVVRALEARDDRTSLAVTGPKGRFCLDPDDKRDLVLIASGTGLAPFMSMIRKMEEDCPQRCGSPSAQNLPDSRCEPPGASRIPRRTGRAGRGHDQQSAETAGAGLPAHRQPTASRSRLGWAEGAGGVIAAN